MINPPTRYTTSWDTTLTADSVSAKTPAQRQS